MKNNKIESIHDILGSVYCVSVISFLKSKEREYLEREVEEYNLKNKVEKNNEL